MIKIGGKHFFSQEKVTRSKLLNVFFGSAQAKTAGWRVGNTGSPDSTFFKCHCLSGKCCQEHPVGVSVNQSGSICSILTTPTVSVGVIMKPQFHESLKSIGKQTNFLIGWPTFMTSPPWLPWFQLLLLNMFRVFWGDEGVFPSLWMLSSGRQLPDFPSASPRRWQVCVQLPD